MMFICATQKALAIVINARAPKRKTSLDTMQKFLNYYLLSETG